MNPVSADDDQPVFVKLKKITTDSISKEKVCERNRVFFVIIKPEHQPVIFVKMIEGRSCDKRNVPITISFRRHYNIVLPLISLVMVWNKNISSGSGTGVHDMQSRCEHSNSM